MGIDRKTEKQTEKKTDRLSYKGAPLLKNNRIRNEGV